MKKVLNGCNYEIHFNLKETKEYDGVVFLDRDGVIIKEKIYIKDPKDVELNPGIQEVLEFLNYLNYKVIVITNQSGIGRGFFDWNDYLNITDTMLRMLGNTVEINSIFACGSVNTKNCNWRKPGIGMIERGWSKKLIQTKNSILIGDKTSDIEAGINSNIKNLFHILTGHGEKEKVKVNSLIAKSKYVFNSRDFKGNLFFQNKNLDELLFYLKNIIDI